MRSARLVPELAAHADWSIDPRKRWVTVASRTTTGWALTAPRPVGDVTSFLQRLSQEAGGGAVALGADFPIGLPRAYAATRPEAGFLGFLRSAAELPGLLHRLRRRSPRSAPTARSTPPAASPA